MAGFRSPQTDALGGSVAHVSEPGSEVPGPGHGRLRCCSLGTRTPARLDPRSLWVWEAEISESPFTSCQEKRMPRVGECEIPHMGGGKEGAQRSRGLLPPHLTGAGRRVCVPLLSDAESHSRPATHPSPHTAMAKLALARLEGKASASEFWPRGHPGCSLASAGDFHDGQETCYAPCEPGKTLRRLVNFGLNHTLNTSEERGSSQQLGSTGHGEAAETFQADRATAEWRRRGLGDDPAIRPGCLLRPPNVSGIYGKEQDDPPAQPLCLAKADPNPHSGIPKGWENTGGSWGSC